jgi:hypothetical protein
MAGSFDNIIRQAMLEQGLTDEQPSAPGLVVPGNIDVHNRQKIPVDGGYATVRSMNFTDDGRSVLIPTAADGRIMTPDEAIAYYDQTGQHLGIFDTPENAEAFGKNLHEQQADEYK